MGHSTRRLRLNNIALLALAATSPLASAIPTPSSHKHKLLPVAPLPVDFSSVDFSVKLNAFKYNGVVVAGPFVKEGAAGVAYSWGSIQSVDKKDTRCYWTSIRSDGYWIKSSIVDRSNKYLPPGPCKALDSAYSPDGCVYNIGTSNGVPFLFKICHNGHSVDNALLTQTVNDFGTILSGYTIVGGSVAVDAASGNVYSTWTVLCSDGTTFVKVIKWCKATKHTDDFYDIGTDGQGQISVASPGGVAVTTDHSGNIIVVGTTNVDITNTDYNPLSVQAIFKTTINDFGQSKGSTVDASFWVDDPNEPLTAVGISYDTTDGSFYVAANSMFVNGNGAIFKFQTITPLFKDFLPMMTIRIPGTITSNLAIVPDGGASFVATLDRNNAKNVFVIDSTLQRYSPVNFPGSNVVPAKSSSYVPEIASIAVSLRSQGLILFGETTYDAFGLVSRLGNPVNRVRLVHKKTGQVITLMNDNRVMLFPADNTPSATRSQVFNHELISRVIFNPLTHIALAVSKTPADAEGVYTAEVGHNVIGLPLKRINKVERWKLDKYGRLVSLLDHKCVSIDRNYLAGNRFVGMAVGLPLVTTKCSSDKMQVFHFEPVQKFD